MNEKIVKNVVEIATENVFEILRKNGFEIKERKNIFKRTEQLLYLMPSLKEAIKHNKNKINDLKKYGIQKKGKAVHIVPSIAPIKQEDSEIIDKEISKLNQRNYIINTQIKWINNIINTLSTDKFYEIIELKYYKKKTHEEMAEYFQCEPKTIQRNKDRIIKYLGSLMFPNDSLNELGV